MVNKSPRPLVPESGQQPDYPINALPEKMRAAAQAIEEHVQAPLALAGQCVIGAAVHLAQTRVNAPDIHSEDGMPCALFMLSLGESGDRKSACSRLAFKEINEDEKAARQNHKMRCDEIRARAAALKGQNREDYLSENPFPIDPGTQYSDATLEPIVGDLLRGKPAAFWNTDEGGQVLAGSTLTSDTRTAALGTLCKLFDGGMVERTRARSNLEGSGVAYDRRLSVHLLAQPVAVAKALADPLLLGQGFLPRFLFASPASIAGTRFIDMDSLESKSYLDPRLKLFWERCRQIMLKSPEIDQETQGVKPPVIPLKSTAEQCWIEFYNEVEAKQGATEEYYDIRPFAGRAAEQARRLAAVFACFEGNELITADCMRSACDLIRYSLQEWLRYSQAVRIAPQMLKASALMDWLRAPKRAEKWAQFHVNELGKSGPASVRRAKDRDRLLNILLNHNHLRLVNDKTYEVVPVADLADFAEGCAIHSRSNADDLRKPAEKKVDDNIPMIHPQVSANHPQDESQEPWGFPQNPLNPQGSRYNEEYQEWASMDDANHQLKQPRIRSSN